MLGLLKRLWANDRGNFAVITAVAILPVAGLSGLAVDFSQAYSVRSTLQGEADAIALAVAAEGPAVSKSRFYDAMAAAAKERVALGTSQFVGRWISPTDYEVTASANVPRTLSRLVPVGGNDIAVEARSLTRYMGARLVYKPPASQILDPHAWDFNRIYAYCYDAEVGKTDKAAARTKRTAIADNDGGKYTDPMPECGSGEAMSFELYNVTEGKYKKSIMTSPNKKEYRYYTDTVIARGPSGELLPEHDKSIAPLLETVLCSSISVCKPGQSGIPYLPNATRKPKTHTGACPVGMFLYYGWEDRPNKDGTGDFDDIRIVIECPELKVVGTENVRLIR